MTPNVQQNSLTFSHFISSDDYSSSMIKAFFVGFDAGQEIRAKNKVFLTGLESLLSTVFPSALFQA